MRIPIPNDPTERRGASQARSVRGRFDGLRALPASVSKNCLVRFDNNKHSASASAVGRPVEIHAHADRAIVYPGPKWITRPSNPRWRCTAVETKRESPRRPVFVDIPSKSGCDVVVLDLSRNSPVVLQFKQQLAIGSNGPPAY